MKFRYIIAALILGLAVGCTQVEIGTLSEIQVSESYVSINVNGGSTTVDINATESWSVDPASVPSWLTVSPMSGSAGSSRLTLSADATKATNNAEVKILCAGQTQYVNVIQYAEKVDPEVISVAKAIELIKAIDKGDGGSYNLDGEYLVKGIVCRIDEIDTGSYGNATYYLSDDGKFVDGKWLEVYRGYWMDNAKFSKGDEFAVGDELTIIGQLMSYRGTPETVQGTAYVKAINKSLISVKGTELLDVEDGEGVTLYPQEGGAIKISIETKGEGFGVVIPAADKSWLHIDDFGSNFVTLVADANQGGDRNTTVEFITTSGDDKYSCEIGLSQKGAILEVSIADFNAAEVGPTLYRITGVISKVASAQYGNYYIKDWSGETYVYGTGAKGDFEAGGWKVGDIVTVVGKRDQYKETIEMTGSSIENTISVTECTIAEFLAKPNSKTDYYMVTGTVKDLLDNKGSENVYGNLHLEDEEGTELYVYGCYPGYGATGDNRKGFIAAAGIEVGDKLTMIGYKDTYNGLIELCGGIYFSHVPANE